MDRIQQYLNGEITTSTVANSNGNWQFHEKANDNVDWYDTHYKWSWAHEHNLNVNGGNEKSQYYVSTNYLNQDGNLRYGDDTYERISANAKINAQPTDWLDIEVNTKYVHYNLDNPLYTDLNGLLYHDIVRMWPMMPFKDPNGYYMRNGKLNQLTNGSRSITSNNNVYLQGQLVFHPLKNWNIYANVGLRLIDQTQRQNLNKVHEHNVVGEPLELAYGGSYASGQTGAMQHWTKANHLTTSLYSDYSFAFNEHKVKVMAGVNTEKYNNRYLSVTRMDLITESVPEVGAATGEDKINGATAYSWATAGFFGRLNYDYKDKYFFAGNLRYDGSSRFLKKDRWGLFGSFSLGWNMAAEEFFAVDDNLIHQLKPRISWGTLGNQNTNSYYPMYLLQSVTTNAGGWLMNGSKPTIASAPSTISSSLTWETVQSLNIGFDLGMFRNRLNVNFDYFIRKTLDMVGPASEIASIYGIGTIISELLRESEVPLEMASCSFSSSVILASESLRLSPASINSIPLFAARSSSLKLRVSESIFPDMVTGALRSMAFFSPEAFPVRENWDWPAIIRVLSNSILSVVKLKFIFSRRVLKGKYGVVIRLLSAFISPEMFHCLIRLPKERSTLKFISSFVKSSAALFRPLLSAILLRLWCANRESLSMSGYIFCRESSILPIRAFLSLFDVSSRIACSDISPLPMDILFVRSLAISLEVWVLTFNTGIL